jgi:ribosomal protein S18 acetylase RimI-like enzyme
MLSQGDALESGVTARICGPSDVDTVVDILVEAFYDDPTWRWVFPDPLRRRAQQAVLWRALAEGAVRYPSVWLSAGDTATAVWIPPDGIELSEVQEAALIATLSDMLSDEGPRVFAVMEAFNLAHPHHEPHYVLSLLGTAAAHRGHGYGLRLLEETLTVVDDADMPAYLEASNPINVALYERYGFELFGSFKLPEDGPDVPTMWRPRRSEIEARDKMA